MHRSNQQASRRTPSLPLSSSSQGSNAWVNSFSQGGVGLTGSNYMTPRGEYILQPPCSRVMRTRRVSGPSRKATLRLICLVTGSHFSRLLASLPHPSTVTLHDIITKRLLLPHDLSWNHCVYPASPLRLPCVSPASPLRLPCVSPASCVLVSSLLRPMSPCVLLRSPVFPRILLRHLASAS